MSATSATIQAPRRSGSSSANAVRTWGVLIVLAALPALAGCLTEAGSPAAGKNVDGAAVGSNDAGSAGAATSTPLVLYLTADGTYSPTPPAEEGYVTISDLANSPVAEGYPTWTGPIASGVERPSVRVVLYATSTGAGVAARVVPGLGDMPGFALYFDSGDSIYGADVEGPPVLRAGEVFEIAVDLWGDGPFAAGAEARFEAVPFYTHVAEASEVRFLVGPDHPSRVEIAAR